MMMLLIKKLANRNSRHPDKATCPLHQQAVAGAGRPLARSLAHRRRDPQPPAQLLQQPRPLLLVALLAGGDQVGPGGAAALALRVDVVQREVLLAATVPVVHTAGKGWEWLSGVHSKVGSGSVGCSGGWRALSKCDQGNACCSAHRHSPSLPDLRRHAFVCMCVGDLSGLSRFVLI